MQYTENPIAKICQLISLPGYFIIRFESMHFTRSSFVFIYNFSLLTFGMCNQDKEYLSFIQISNNNCLSYNYIAFAMFRIGSMDGIRGPGLLSPGFETFP